MEGQPKKERKSSREKSRSAADGIGEALGFLLTFPFWPLMGSSKPKYTSSSKRKQ